MGSDQVSFDREGMVSGARVSALLVKSRYRDGSMGGDSKEA